MCLLFHRKNEMDCLAKPIVYTMSVEIKFKIRSNWNKHFIM